MTITIEVAPERGAHLQEQAQEAGLPIERYVARLVEQAAPWPLPEEVRHLTPEERAERFLRWADSHDPSIPALSPEAVSRESLYADDEEDPDAV